MALSNTHDSYGSLAKWFHWLVAIGIIMMLILGACLGFIPKPTRFVFINIHKSLGLTILVLMVLRLLWRWVNPTPRLPSNIPAWQRFGAHLTHGLLYLTVILIPLSGLAMSTAGGYTTKFWWWFTVKMPWVPKDKSLGHLFENIHYYLAWVVTALLIIHILAAIKHHLIDRDNVLKRMLPKREPKYFR
ncbi:MAG: cytochrome b [Gammaproteobacteria bacterium]|nr:cytochrome b [Gammaproteobacteria bacterium]